MAQWDLTFQDDTPLSIEDSNLGSLISVLLTNTLILQEAREQSKGKKIYNHEVVKCMNQFAPIQNSTLYASDNPLYVSTLFPLLFQFSD